MTLQEFLEAWQLFVKNLQDVAQRELVRRNSQAGYSELGELLEKVIADILGNQGLAQMQAAVEREMSEDEVVVKYLQHELNFFNVAHEAGRDAEDEADDGDTIKTSIEKIFEIPDWLKKRLKILNEILKILRG